MIYKKRMPESFHLSTTYCAADYFSILLHPQKIQLFTLYSKSKLWTTSQTRIRQKIVTIHWKTIPYQETLVFRVYFSSSIMELQKCSLAYPYREVLEQSHVYLLGLVDTGGFGSVGYLAFDFLDSTDNQTKIKKRTLHKHWFALVSERAAWLVQMVRIHS